VTETTIALFQTFRYDALSRTFGITVITLLVVLLVEKELVRAFNKTRRPQWMQALDVAIFPLFIGFSLIILIRLLQLMGLAGLR
jgi:hypothetical protein